MIVSACMFILGYAMTWAPGVWILIGETFPTRTRAKQGALATASNWYVFLLCQCRNWINYRLWNFLLAFFTPFIISAIDFRYGFVFAGTCIISWLTRVLILIGSMQSCWSGCGLSLPIRELQFKFGERGPGTLLCVRLVHLTHIFADV